jgi:hypothetical protein
VFENDLILTQEKLSGKRKTVVFNFENFLFWRDRLHLQNMHKVIDLIEEFVSVRKHVFEILEPVLRGPILP